MNCFFILTSILSTVAALDQLALSGGGSFGAVEIGILKRVNEMHPKKYDLYTGISAGALNTGFLSYFEDINIGINNASELYSSIKNHMIYEIIPKTGLSILNTAPLHKTLTNIIDNMPNQPSIHTLIGAANLYSGKLDVYNFEDQDDLSKVLLLMCSSAIPVAFPPIQFNNQLYADGGTLSNELLQVDHDNNYLNITLITPYDDLAYDNTPITSLEEMIHRTFVIVKNDFNNPMATMNQNCKNPIGEINKYYVPSAVLKGYSILNFDKGSELVDIGYNNVVSKRYRIC